MDTLPKKVWFAMFNQLQQYRIQNGLSWTQLQKEIGIQYCVVEDLFFNVPISSLDEKKIKNWLKD